MATGTWLTEPHVVPSSSNVSLWDGIKRVLDPVASLRLTVVLFALSIFLILAGTFAQVELDIWDVIGLYFRVWFAWVPFQIFLPASFFTENPVKVDGGIWFPGGKLLGLLLAVNLVSAHLIRFKVAATGRRLMLGWAGIAVGCVITWLIVFAGGNPKGIQGAPLIPYSTQWIGYQGFLGLVALASFYGLFRLQQIPLPVSGERRSRHLFLKSALAVIGIALVGLLGWLLQQGSSVRPSDSSLRILWQLTQGTAAALALLGGCWGVFGNRAGIVLLHGGIGLMMFYELHVALTAVETQMNISEGERTNYVHDIRTIELAVVDQTNPSEESVVAIPKSMILAKKPIDDPDLPFKIKFVDFQPNTVLRAVSTEDKNESSTGVGLKWYPEPIKPGAGADADSRVDAPALYVELTAKSDGQSLGTYLVSEQLSLMGMFDTIHVGEHDYHLELRPKRYYKPYLIELKDVRKEDYIGTTTPRHYASTVHITDSTRSVDEEKTIWMNNPLRFADETFYQSGYAQDPATGIERTTLSVVANSGWMMPYVGCMLVGVGMLVHFLTLLVRFLTRGDSVNLSTDEQARAAALAQKLGIRPAAQPTLEQPATKKASLKAKLFAASVTLLALVYVGMIARPPKQKALSFDYYRFGQIPVVSEGRVKPLETAATAALLTISGKSQMEVEPENPQPPTTWELIRTGGRGRSNPKFPAIQWLLEVISDSPIADQRHVFRIENLELQDTLGIKKREGMRYSRDEIQPHFKEFLAQYERAQAQQERDHKKLSPAQKKALELGSKFMMFGNLKSAFGAHNQIGGENNEAMLKSFQDAMMRTADLEERGRPVFAIPPSGKEEKWHTLSRGWILNLVEKIQNKSEGNKVVELWDEILKAYANDNPSAFNKSVDELLAYTNSHPVKDAKPWVVQLEAYFNYIRPFAHADVLYVIAFVLSALGWLFWAQAFNRAAFGVLLVTFALHSAALLARLIISGRPPVTNLYSSAVFIGWFCVLLGLLFELVYRMGIGNLVAAVAGFATLLIADGLASDGDTFTVLQAVLDTQFWLATHVTCITLGYATTYLAGLFGVVYILRGVLTPSLSVDDGRDITRMIYGTICFSIFFSFVGTVLGGLWADDSWGRFWGWDPKENAALMIVLWNALALHARWGGMVRERGLAALAVAGNIFVSWSWWGVNALGTGLHTYGFKEGTLRNLGLFILVNLMIITLAALPKSYWWSYQRQAKEA